jgi:diguanylate cyclase (GGDEF)-like protein
MKFRVSGRHDSLLLAGFAFTLLVIFQRSLQYMFDVARDVERTYGVALVPALTILTVMFVFHQYANRREVKAEAAAAAVEASLARARAEELERLMALGQSLSRSLTADALHEAIWRHLPGLSGNADVWVLLKIDHDWERVTDRAGTRWPAGELEQIARAIETESPDRLARPEGLTRDGHVCHPILTMGRVTGVIGMEARAAAASVQHTVGAAATLLGISLRNVQLFSEVRDNGLKDKLTGCFNRSHGLETLESEIVRARRSDAPLSVLMFDVDHFKRINDQHGHLSGDAVLAAVGSRLRQVLRRSDVRCRYGSDEFLVILPETPSVGAMRVADWIRGEMEQVTVAQAPGLALTVSIGAATAQQGETADLLIERADRALYAAKAAGRNCARAATTSLRPVTPAPAVALA